MPFMQKILDKLFFSKTISQIVFEWRESNRLFLISLCIGAELFVQWLGYSFVWFGSDILNITHLVNDSVLGMLWIISGQLLLIFGWVAIYTYKQNDTNNPNFKWLQYFISFVYLAYSGFVYTSFGVINIFTGISLVASTVIAVLLMHRRLIWKTFLAHIFLVCVLIFLPTLGVNMPHIYKTVQLSGDEHHFSMVFWYSFYLYLSLPKAILSVGLSLHMVKGIEDKLDEFQYQANYDKLTKVTNRRYIMKYLFDILFLSINDDNLDEDEEDSSSALSVILLDIDFFKNINDTYGHLSGDMVLIELAKRISENLDKKRGMEVCRHGGEEFLVVLPNMSHKKAMEFAGELKKSLCSEQYRVVDGMSISVTSSFGVATFEDDEVLAIRRQYYFNSNNKQNNYKLVDTQLATGEVTASQEDLIIENLINMADGALYDAKRLGRNRIISANQYVDETSSQSSIELNAVRTEEILQDIPLERTYQPIKLKRRKAETDKVLVE